MAQGIAKCTCKTCGTEFKRTAIKNNREAAESWARWAEENFDECEDCYKKRMQKEKEEMGLILTVSVSSFKDKKVKLAFSGNTYPAKENIKGIGGYRWQDYEWQKTIDYADLNAEIEKAKEIGATVNNLSDDDKMNMEFDEQIIKFKKFMAENEDMIEEIKPEMVKGKKVGGISRKNSQLYVEIDGKEVNVTKEQADEIFAWQNSVFDMFKKSQL